MGYNIGRRGGETYPDRSASGGSPPANIPPFSNLGFVDLGTSTPAPSQTGSVAAPFSTVQGGLDAGFTALYITGDFSAETVTVPGLGVFLTGANAGVALAGLVLPDGCSAQLDNVGVGNITAGDGCTVISNSSVGNDTFGDNGFLILNGPGALDFPAKIDQLALANLTMGPGGVLVATNTVVSSGAAIVADVIELFGCSSVAASMACINLNAQSTLLTVGNYTTTGVVVLQDVRADAAVSFLNAVGQAFQVDGFTNYWLKTNSVSFTNVGEKVITEDLTP